MRALRNTSAQNASKNALMGRALYHSNVVDHFENPRNVGSLDAKDPSVGSAIVGAPRCGDVMKLQVKIKDGVIEDVKFRTFGCGSAIASSSYAAEWLKGKTVEEAKKLKNTDIASYLSLPPVKLHCSMLAEDAVKAAFADYDRKQAQRQGGVAEGESQGKVNSKVDDDDISDDEESTAAATR